MKIACVLPAHNEAASLVRTTEQVVKWGAERFAGHTFEVVVSENGSSDDSASVARVLAQTLPGVWAVLSHKPGKGGAIKRGAAAVEADIYLTMDCDLSTDLSSAGKLADLVIGGTDLAIASRRMPDSKVERPLLRRGMTWFYSNLASAYLGLGVRDAHCGCKAFSRKVRNTVLPTVQDEGFFFDTELLARSRHQGLGIVEVGAVWKEGRVRKSSVPLLATAFDFLKKLPVLKRSLRS